MTEEFHVTLNYGTYANFHKVVAWMREQAFPLPRVLAHPDPGHSILVFTDRNAALLMKLTWAGM